MESQWLSSDFAALGEVSEGWRCVIFFHHSQQILNPEPAQIELKICWNNLTKEETKKTNDEDI
jgi:hypothetical protein